MRIKYSPHSRIVLNGIKNRFGRSIVSNIMKAVRGLAANPNKGASVERFLGIQNPYYFLHIEKFYIFYRFDEETIFVNEIFNEKEDFMSKMFGIELRTQESIDYWGE